jgi:hypothetical protein
MATKRQIDANRQNAKRSTGPITVAGRARSKRNALKHGLTAREVTVDEEEASKLEAFRDDIVWDLAPEGALEEELAQQIATDSWRLRRVLRLEAALAVPRDILELSLASLQGPAFQFMSNGSGLNLVRYQVAIDRSRQRALHELQRLQARRRGEAVAAPIAVDVTHSIDARVGPAAAVSRPAPSMTREHSNGSASVAAAPAVSK